MTQRQYMKTYVELRLVFVKIGQIDTINEQYQADVFLQCKWREPALDGCQKNLPSNATSLWNPRLSIENVFTDVRETISREVEFEKSGSSNSLAYVVEKRRLKGTFLETLELKDFPFDVQDLSITVVTELCSDDVELIECNTQLSRVNTAAFVDAQEWTLHEHVEITRRIVQSDCQVGPRRRPSATFTCRAARRFGYFVINNLLVSVLICLLSFAAFAVPRANSHGRLQLSFLLLLTTVTFKFVAGHSLPRISYLTYMDKLLLGNLAFLIVMCAWHAFISLVPESNTDFTYSEKYFILAMLLVYISSILVYILRIYKIAGNNHRKVAQKDLEFRERVQEMEMSSKQDSCDV